jgi:hypothetical protein
LLAVFAEPCDEEGLWMRGVNKGFCFRLDESESRRFIMLRRRKQNSSFSKYSIVQPGVKVYKQTIVYKVTLILGRSDKPIVCQMARQLPNQRVKFLSRLDRLEDHLVKDSNFDAKIKAQLPDIWLPFMQDETPIILDLSDIAKPLAKKMEYLATVRDGSSGQLVNGYWVVELYASVSCKNPVPIMLEPFSHEEPCSPGQNPIVLNAVHKVFELTNSVNIKLLSKFKILNQVGF